MSHRIAAENLGPIANIEFALQSPGVTVLVAPNGSGKSILLDAVQAAARGDGKLPLRDRTKRGKVEAFGATITIGGTCRHTGSFEVTHLEGKFDLAALVDPRLKSPSAADRARVKALVLLTGVRASADLFRNHAAFADFDTVVTQEALATEDIVEMAAKIKDCYDTAALAKERLAQREYGKATALIAPSDLDINEESDAVVLQEAYDAARDEVTRLSEQARNARAAQNQFEQAQRIVADIGGEGLLKEQAELKAFLDGVDDQVSGLNSEIVELTRKLEQKRAELQNLQSRSVTARARVASIDRQLQSVEEAKKVLQNPVKISLPDERDIRDAQAAVEAARAAIALGVRIREAKANAKLVQQHRDDAKAADDSALRYRDAGKATDEVLSLCIQCPQLRVESDGKSARLVTNTSRGESVPYHELSEGERWRLAIDIGADQVGAGGLLVISQVGWEGIDGANRIAIHQHAIERQVYILTAEAASDPNAPPVIVPTPLPSTPPQKPAMGDRPKPEEKPPAKPVEKPPTKVQKTQPPPKPAVPQGDDADDIPF